MTIVHVTEAAIEVAKHYHVENELYALKADCESRHLAEAIRLFESRPPYKYKRLPPHLRLIAKQETVDGIPILCFLTLLRKGEREADLFNYNPADYGEGKLERLIDRDALSAVVQQERNKEERLAEANRKPELEGPVRNWWLTFEEADSADELVMESEEWVKQFQTREYSDYWQSYHRLVRELVTGRREEVQKWNGPQEIYWLQDEDNHTVFFTERVLETDREARDTISIIYLLIAANGLREPESMAANLAKRYDWIGIDVMASNMDAIARHSARGYPSYLLADPDVWRHIEHDRDANLALSGEEAQLLGSVRHAHSGSGEPALPIFINGRAGSGKSTLLYFLFSDYLRRKYDEHIEVKGDLVFLTYSERLLNNARETVRKLLRFRSDFLAGQPLPTVDETLDRHFQPFLDFVLNCVPNHEKHRFLSDKLIDYRRFQQLYNGYNLPAELAPHALRVRPPRGISVDLAWHVIRTYIKGYSPEEHLEPDGYDDVPPKDKSVSPGAFGEVYSTVWNQWYRHLTGEVGLWDALDLVRTAITEGWVQPDYGVVFCDEAQDFTRVEIDFILHLLIYRNYDLGWERQSRLPFALAGDPFQTLNPTGFRWESLKASFFDEITRNLDPEGRGIVDFRYKELLYNYRSVLPIVRLSNLMLLWRELLFEIPDISPQRPWREEHAGHSPLLFVLGQTLTNVQFAEVAEDSVLIVPSDEGQEDEYASQDTILSDLRAHGSTVTIISPIAAKGLEFKRVILYKFGDACPSDLFQDIPVTDVAKRLEREYFLNKLYVGATRGMLHLLVVDTVEGVERLWRHTLDSRLIENFRSQTKKPAKWEGTLFGVTRATYAELQVLDKEDPLEIARSLRQGGTDQKNPYLLRQAIPLFRRAGQELSAQLCEAEALELEGQEEKAGELFEQVGHHQDAERCYWKAMSWQNLAALFSTALPNGSQFHRLAASMVTSPSNMEPMLQLVRHMDSLISSGRSIPLSEPQILFIIKTSIERVWQKVTEGEYDRNVLIALTDLLISLPPAVVESNSEHAAQLYFRAHRYEEAVEMWERHGQPSVRDYYLAKAAVSPSPDNIHWWGLAGEHAKVVAEYERTKEGLSASGKEIVAKAYQSLGNVSRACELFLEMRQLGALKDAFALGLVQPPNERTGLVVIADRILTTLLNENELDVWERIVYQLVRHAPEWDVTGHLKHALGLLLKANRTDRAMAYTVTEDLRARGSSRFPTVKRRTLPGIDALALDALQTLVLTHLAYADAVESIDDKRQASEYIRHVTEGGTNWKGLSLREMSSAIEKNWREIDILPFYERLESGLDNDSDRRFVRERWLKAKSRQIARIEKDELTDTRNRRLLNERSREWHIDHRAIESLSNYPDLASASQASAPVLTKEFSVKWSRPKCRIVCIANSPEGGESELIIDVSRGVIEEFGGVNFTGTMQQVGAATFTVEEWGLMDGRIAVGRSLEFTVGDQKYEFQL